MIDTIISRIIMSIVWKDTSDLPKLPRHEILAAIGFGNKPMHSMRWYVRNYRHFKRIVMDHIREDIDGEGIFPREAKFFSPLDQYKLYPASINKADHGLYTVLMHDQECGAVSKMLQFIDVDSASEYLLRHANGTAAAKLFQRP